MPTPVDPELVAEALRRGAINEDQARGYLGITPPETVSPLRQGLIDAANRGGEDLKGVVNGVLQAGQGVLGSAGDIASIMDPHSPLPTSAGFGDAMSDLSGALGGPTALEKSTSPEGPFLQAGTRGAVSMLSGNPWVAGVGALSGVTGEIGDRLNGSPEDGSLGRTVGEVAGMLPLLLGFKAPPGVRPMQEAMQRMGPEGFRPATSYDISNSIARAQAKSDVAAKALLMPHTSLWSQLPQLNPEIQAIRSSPMGASLNAQADNEAAAIAREIKPNNYNPGGKLSPIWSPDFGEIDPKNALGNIQNQAAATAPKEQTSDILSRAGNSLIGTIVAHLNPFDLPKAAGEAIVQARGKAGIRGIAEALSGPDAGNALRAYANYSGSTNAMKKIAQALMSIGVGSNSNNIGPNPEISGQ